MCYRNRELCPLGEGGKRCFPTDSWVVNCSCTHIHFYESEAYLRKKEKSLMTENEGFDQAKFRHKTVDTKEVRQKAEEKQYQPLTPPPQKLAFILNIGFCMAPWSSTVSNLSAGRSAAWARAMPSVCSRTTRQKPEDSHKRTQNNHKAAVVHRHIAELRNDQKKTLWIMTNNFVQGLIFYWHKN